MHYRGVLKHPSFKKFNVHISTASFTVKKKAGKPGFPVGEWANPHFGAVVGHFYEDT